MMPKQWREHLLVTFCGAQGSLVRSEMKECEHASTQTGFWAIQVYTAPLQFLDSNEPYHIEYSG